MTADDTVEITQIVEASAYSLTSIILLVWGFVVGGYIPGFFGRMASPKRHAHRKLLWVMGLGAFFAAFGIWVLSEDSGAFVRTDGENSEYSRQIAIGLASIALAYAYAIYSNFTHPSTVLFSIMVIAIYAFATFATLTVQTVMWWICFAFWFAALIAASIFGWVNIRIEPTWIYGNYAVGVIFIIFVILQGLWLILSQQVSKQISLEVESGLYTATDIVLFWAVSLCLGFTYPGTRTLKAMRRPLPPQQRR